MLDTWEIQHFGDLNQGPDDDPDGDGLTNATEFALGTSPVVVTPPEPVTSMSAVPGDAENTISWNDVSTATGLNLYWSTIPGVTKANGNLIADVTSSFVHTGLINGTTYFYVVTSFNGSGEPAESPNAPPPRLEQAAHGVLQSFLAVIPRPTRPTLRSRWTPTVTR